MPNMQQTLEQDNLVTITIHTKRRDAEVEIFGYLTQK